MNYVKLFESFLNEASPKFDVEFENEQDGQFHREEAQAQQWKFSPIPPITVVSVNGNVSEDRDELDVVLSNGDKLSFSCVMAAGDGKNNFAKLTINDKIHEVKELFTDNLGNYGSVIIAVLKTYEAVQYSDEALGI